MKAFYYQVMFKVENQGRRPSWESPGPQKSQYIKSKTKGQVDPLFHPCRGWELGLTPQSLQERGAERALSTPVQPTSFSAAFCNMTSLDLSFLTYKMGTCVPGRVLIKT